MRTVISKPRQTAFDIAMQEMGSIEGLIDVLTMNQKIVFQ